MKKNLNAIRLLTIDFTQPWWRIITDQKMLAFAAFFLEILRDVFWAVAPFLVVWVLEKGNWYIFVAVCGIWIVAEVAVLIQRHISARFQLQCIHSIYYSAHQYLLTIDPHYHIKRSSGVVLGKIDRAARGYEELLDQTTYEFVPMTVGIVVMLIILVQYSLLLTLGVSACLFGMIAYGYYFTQYVCGKRESAFIQTDDEFRSAAFENLAQVQLIRATFATDYMRSKLTRRIHTNSYAERDVWLLYSSVSRVLSVMYTTSILLLLGFFMYRVHNGLADLPIAIGIILAYIQSTKQLMKIFRPLRQFKRGLTAIQDLFEFMPNFGKQTIPVFMQQEYVMPEQKETVIAASDLLFAYNGEHIFNGHSLHLLAGAQQRNKLYGIIGPSGAGKTTLLSILGGQLKPCGGSVTINGIDIYAVGDTTRRQLIALQGQVATNVKGSLRYNLLFGLPQEHGYNDDHLLEVMRRVGLERVLKEHNGLDTILGEGGLNISGGQRQRLNFAGLYLRARYYKPALILIDEPTSSLDEISEQAVTSMISELALKAVTFVIAHRLKTLRDAAGLIDLSLLQEAKDIHVYSTHELEQRSVYYRRLLEGKDEL